MAERLGRELMGDYMPNPVAQELLEHAPASGHLSVKFRVSEIVRRHEEVVYTLDQLGREALSKLALKFTKSPRTGKPSINVHEGRVARVHFEPSDK